MTLFGGGEQPQPGQKDIQTTNPAGVPVPPVESASLVANTENTHGATVIPGRKEAAQALRTNSDDTYIEVNELDEKLHNRLISEVVTPKPNSDSLVLFQNASDGESVPGFLLQSGLVLVSPDEFQRIQSSVVPKKTGFPNEPDIQALPEGFDLKYDLVDDTSKMEKWKDGVSRSKEATERIVRQEIATKEFIPQGLAHLRALSQSVTIK